MYRKHGATSKKSQYRTALNNGVGDAEVGLAPYAASVLVAGRELAKKQFVWRRQLPESRNVTEMNEADILKSRV
jgi:hypothetical protein